MESTLWFLKATNSRFAGKDVQTLAMVMDENELRQYFGEDINRMVEGEQDEFKILYIYLLEDTEDGIREAPGPLRLTEAMELPDGWFGKIKTEYIAVKGSKFYIHPDTYYLKVDDLE